MLAASEPRPPCGERLASPLIHAVVFSARAGFAQEFWPLAVDARVRDIGRHGMALFRVLGVPVDALDADGHFRRAVSLDPRRNRLVEFESTAPLTPHSAQFLCLGRREQTLHRALSGFMQCPQVNPAACAELADDKAATLAGWTGLGLEVPRTRRLERGQTAAAVRFITGFGDSVIKPNNATEGLGVTFLSSDWAARSTVARALDRAWCCGAALIQQRRDGLLYRDPATGRTHTVALRLNLMFDGGRHHLTSGYAQVGPDVWQPAACGCGGRTVTLAHALTHLTPRNAPSWPVPPLDARRWAELTEQAVRAAGLFQKLLLVGIDVVLDLDAAGRIVPVFLEANARPAGLGQARLCSGLPTPNDAPGVGLAIWDCLERRCGARPSRDSGPGRGDADETITAT